MIEVLKPGIFSSVQDLGRFGYRSFGVPLSGVMDQASAITANNLLGNPSKAAVIEFTGPGLTLKFRTATKIAVCGAKVDLTLNDKNIDLSKVINVDPGSVLKAGNSRQGVWAYMAILGGVDSEVVLGSKSMYKSLTKHSRLGKEMKLGIGNAQLHEAFNSLSIKSTRLVNNEAIEIMKGPEFDLLSEDDVIKILGTDFVISPQSNRMAYLLDHDLEISTKEIITSAVQPGTVQLTPSGKLLVLMRDAQTTGGYARIFQLTENAINCLSQRKPRATVSFRVI